MIEGRCQCCGRLDAKAGAVWGCPECLRRYESGLRWWDTPFASTEPGGDAND